MHSYYDPVHEQRQLSTHDLAKQSTKGINKHVHLLQYIRGGEQSHAYNMSTLRRMFSRDIYIKAGPNNF